MVPLLTLAFGRVRFQNKIEGGMDLAGKKHKITSIVNLLIHCSCRDLLLLYTSYLTLCLIGIHCAALMLIDIW